uniref:Threonine--tRNA ligase n=1 Tax=Lygus hesperus TaxID=30085 RepID=A0A0A9Y0H0_LYGHE
MALHSNKPIPLHVWRQYMEQCTSEFGTELEAVVRWAQSCLSHRTHHNAAVEVNVVVDIVLLTLSTELRRCGLAVEPPTYDRYSNQIRQASVAPVALLVGEREIAEGYVQCKVLSTQVQHS